MPIVIAKWPNGTFSVVLMQSGFSMADLFWKLDEEADPQGATPYLLRRDKDGEAHATFDWDSDDILERKSGEEKFIKLGPETGRLDTCSGRLKKLKWPRGIVRTAYRAAFGQQRGDRKESLRTISSDELKDFPAEPSETFSVEDVRAMSPFCGVYFAYNADGSCHYIGESKNVPSRVSGSREEIDDRRIGVVKCEPHERKRIEAYFVAMLDPPGNAISTHRVRAADQRARANSSLDREEAMRHATESLADCLASVAKRGPQSKKDICDIASSVVPHRVLLELVNRDRIATNRQLLEGFSNHPCRTKQWACEQIARCAVELLVRSGRAIFDQSAWVLSLKEPESNLSEVAR